MRKTIALVMAAAVIIMICGCAKKEQAPVQTGVTEAEKKIVINDGKTPETVERVPDQVASVQSPQQTQAQVQAAAPAKAEETKPAETRAAAEAKTAGADIAQYAGKYTRTEDGSTFTLTKDGKADISIVRLTQMDGRAEGISDGVIRIKAKDANDGDMGLEFRTATNELVVTDSKWNLLPNGETFKFDKKE